MLKNKFYHLLLLFFILSKTLYGSDQSNSLLLTEENDFPKISVSQVHADWIRKDREDKKIPMNIDKKNSFTHPEFKLIVEKELEYPEYFPFYHAEGTTQGFIEDTVKLFNSGFDQKNYSFHTMFPRIKGSIFSNIDDFWIAVNQKYPEGFFHPVTENKELWDEGGYYEKHWNDHREFFREQIMCANLSYFGGCFTLQPGPGENALGFRYYNTNVKSPDILHLLKKYLSSIGLSEARISFYEALYNQHKKTLEKQSYLCQIFIHHSVVNDLVTLTGPWGAPIKRPHCYTTDQSSFLILNPLETLLTYRQNPSSIDVQVHDITEHDERGYTHKYGPHYLGARDIQARILTNEKLFKTGNNVIVYKYLNNLRGMYNITTAFGYYLDLKRLIQEDINDMVKNNYQIANELIDTSMGSKLLIDAVGNLDENLVKDLLKNGVNPDINVPDYECSLLSFAEDCLYNSEEIVRLLKQYIKQ
jgi:hypothetical protein